MRITTECGIELHLSDTDTTFVIPADMDDPSIEQIDECLRLVHQGPARMHWWKPGSEFGRASYLTTIDPKEMTR